MKKKSLIIILVTIVLLIFIVFFIKKVIIGYSRLIESEKNSEYVYNQKFDKQDSLVFNTLEMKNLKPNFVLHSKYRNDFKCFDYKKLGVLFYTSFNLTNDIPMDKFIWFREVETSRTALHPYDKFNGDSFEFGILSERESKIDTIIFTMTGDASLLQMNVYNKNFVSYYSPVTTFSLRFGENSPIDVYFKGKESKFGGNTYPLMVSFYKRQKTIYFFYLIPNKNEMNLRGDLFGLLLNRELP